MKLFSTKGQAPDVNLEEAVFRGLPQDNGLYMPYELPKLPPSFYDTIEEKSFSEIAFEVSKALIGDEIPADRLKNIIEDTLNFDCPAVEIEEDTYVLELFHGPSLAFKDFGARFMSRVMGYFLEKSKKEINILVATSGDTGGAVAMGFLGTPGIKVTILYPKGKVSTLQEKQLTTLGQNISALEVNGTFDDCQAMVKEAFLDAELKEKYSLSSANSINIARLIPQSFYYHWTYAQLKKKGKPVVFSVPSGNFGNITAGLFAQQMGLPVAHYVASTNANNIVPQYLETGKYEPRASVATLSNAMDVGAPSNFARMNNLYEEKVENFRAHLSGYSFSDEQTVACIRDVYERTGYIMCPHTAVAYLGLKQYGKESGKNFSGVLLSTAHPSKFIDVLDKDIATKVEIPERLAKLMDNKKVAQAIEPKFEELKQYIIDNN